MKGVAPTLASVGMGCARVGEATGGVSWRSSVRMIRDAVDGGVTFFDTADAYTNGTSERMLGHALAGGRREHVTLATKAGYRFRPRSELEARCRFLIGPVVRRFGQQAVATATTATGPFTQQDFSVEYLRTALSASLARLRVDHVDLFQLHAPRNADVRAVSELMAELIAAGVVRRFGIGVEELAEVEPWLGVGGLHSVQMPISVLDPVASADTIERARSNGVSVIARGVLGAGIIDDVRRLDDLRAMTPFAGVVGELRALAKASGRTVREIAIDYVRARSGVDVVVIGVRLPHQLGELVDAVGRASPDLELLAQVDEIVRRQSGEAAEG